LVKRMSMSAARSRPRFPISRPDARSIRSAALSFGPTCRRVVGAVNIPRRSAAPAAKKSLVTTFSGR
jgi:hypothetical protein